MMFVAISQARACRYCEAAHLACCRMLGIEPSAIEELVSNVTEISPPKRPRAHDRLEYDVRLSLSFRYSHDMLHTA